MIFSGEHLLILVVVFLFFGPRFLPNIGQTLGKSVRNLKDGLAGVKEPSFQKLSETIIKEEKNS